MRFSFYPEASRVGKRTVWSRLRYMEESLSWETNGRSASQEVHIILRDPCSKESTHRITIHKLINLFWQMSERALYVSINLIHIIKDFPSSIQLKTQRFRSCICFHRQAKPYNVITWAQLKSNSRSEISFSSGPKWLCGAFSPDNGIRANFQDVVFKAKDKGESPIIFISLMSHLRQKPLDKSCTSRC